MIKLGTYAECSVDVNFEETATKEEIKEFDKTIQDDERLSCNINEYDYFFASGRVQNLEWQLEIFKDICEKFKKIINEANGTIMIESGYGISFSKGDEENE